MNTGHFNTGDFNTGYFNTGNNNTGDHNTGVRNTGYFNTGDNNTGNGNTGDFNTGSRNKGDWNTGSRNKGDWNTGDWNTCSHSAGFFNTKEQKVPVFNGAIFVNRAGFFNTKEQKVPVFNGAIFVNRAEFINSAAYKALFSVDFKLTEWVPERACTEAERALSNYIKGEGVLISRPFKEACSLWWNEITEENKALIQTMVGFDADIFHEITGVDVGRKSSDMQTLKQENQTLLDRISKLESE